MDNRRTVKQVFHSQPTLEGAGVHLKEGRMLGFQLWANLPAESKMMSPRYQDIRATEIPTLILDDEVMIKVICGEVNGTCGPVRDIMIDPVYLDIAVPAGVTYRHATKIGHTVLELYLYLDKSTYSTSFFH
nr:hypothetical protein [Desulfobulbaceae bacterium]